MEIQIYLTLNKFSYTYTNSSDPTFKQIQQRIHSSYQNTNYWYLYSDGSSQGTRASEKKLSKTYANVTSKHFFPKKM